MSVFQCISSGILTKRTKKNVLLAKMNETLLAENAFPLKSLQGHLTFYDTAIKCGHHTSRITQFLAHQRHRIEDNIDQN